MGLVGQSPPQPPSPSPGPHRLALIAALLGSSAAVPGGFLPPKPKPGSGACCNTHQTNPKNLILLISPDVFSASAIWARYRKLLIAQRVSCRGKPTVGRKYGIEGYVVLALLKAGRKSQCYSQDHRMAGSSQSFQSYLLHVCLQQVAQPLHQLGEPRPLVGVAPPAVHHDLVAVKTRAK